MSAGGIFRAADYTYDPETGDLIISGESVTGNIEISAVCEAAPGQGGNPGEGGQNPTPGSGSQTDGNAQLTGNGQQNTGSSGNSAADSKTVQTGDDTSAVLWITVLAAAVLIGGTTTVIIIRKRRG